tara:strand:+ start:155 stop:1027 length:873 start_codon:yes stop_codon:yes gene_type:complete
MNNRKVTISVIVLTYNNELMIERCLRSIGDLSDDIIIIDSYSTDKTKQICKKLGARFVQHEFKNQGVSINWALENLHIKNEWVLQLDSDELLPKALKEEIKIKIRTKSKYIGYYLNRRMYWMNRWLRHGRMYPHYILRLFLKGYARWEECEEHHAIPNGKCGYLKNDFLEDNRHNNLEQFMVKHLRTAETEVKEHFQGVSGETVLEPKLFGTKAQRTRWVKLNIYSRIPIASRAFFYFIYRYFICLGFLDGREGRIFHILHAFWYRYYIDARIYEEKNDWQKQINNYTDI